MEGLVVLHEEFGDFSTLEDEDFEDGAVGGEFGEDEVVGDGEDHRVVHADEQHSGDRLYHLSFLHILNYSIEQ